MNYSDEIYARLTKGESLEDIAKEITESLNEASKKYEEDQKASQEDLRADKIDAIEIFLEDIANILALWECDSEIIDAIGDLKVEDVVDSLDALIPFYNKYYKEAFLIQEKKDKKPAAEPAVKPEVTDPLEDFLNHFVR